MRRDGLAIVLFIASVALGPREAGAAAGDKPWSEILGASQATLPAPHDEVKWRSDLGNALRQAQAENRPVFVTMRCLPCKQCSAFDKNVLEGGAELDPLLK